MGTDKRSLPLKISPEKLRKMVKEKGSIQQAALKTGFSDYRSFSRALKTGALAPEKLSKLIDYLEINPRDILDESSAYQLNHLQEIENEWSAFKAFCLFYEKAKPLLNPLTPYYRSKDGSELRASKYSLEDYERDFVECAAYCAVHYDDIDVTYISPENHLYDQCIRRIEKSREEIRLLKKMIADKSKGFDEEEIREKFEELFL